MYVVLKFIDYISIICLYDVCVLCVHACACVCVCVCVFVCVHVGVCMYTIHMCQSIHLPASASMAIHVREMFKGSYSYVIFLLVDHSAGEEQVTVAEGICVGS